MLSELALIRDFMVVFSFLQIRLYKILSQKHRCGWQKTRVEAENRELRKRIKQEKMINREKGKEEKKPNVAGCY